jgi:hypothetical protein
MLIDIYFNSSNHAGSGEASTESIGGPENTKGKSLCNLRWREVYSSI